MTVLIISAVVILVCGAALCAWAMLAWLRVVEEGKSAKRLPKKDAP